MYVVSKHTKRRPKGNNIVKIHLQRVFQLKSINTQIKSQRSLPPVLKIIYLSLGFMGRGCPLSRQDTTLKLYRNLAFKLLLILCM